MFNEPDANDLYPAFSSRVVTGLAPNSIGEMRDGLDKIERSSSHSVRAEAVLRGDARLQPGRVIFLSGVGERDEDYWLVVSVNHVFTGSHYRSQVVLERPERPIGVRAEPPPTLEYFQDPLVPDEDARRFVQATRRKSPIISWYGETYNVESPDLDMRAFPPDDGVPDVGRLSEEEKRVIDRRATERPMLHGEWRARVAVDVGAPE